jgi:hypothetical protein
VSDPIKAAADKAKKGAEKQRGPLAAAAHKAEAFLDERTSKVRDRIARRHDGGGA